MIRIPEDKTDHINDLNIIVTKLTKFLDERNPIEDADRSLSELTEVLKKYIQLIRDDEVTSDKYNDLIEEVDYAFGQWYDACEEVRTMQHHLAAIFDEFDSVIKDEYLPDED